MRLAGLCKGSTADSDSVCEGSNPSPAAKIHQPDYSGQADVFVFSIDLCDFPSKVEVLKCVDYPAQSILKCVVFLT